MEGFSLNNISDCYVGATGASQIWLGNNLIWQRQTYTWVTIPSYRTIYGTNIPNYASIYYSAQDQCVLRADILNDPYNFTYILDPDTSYAYRNLNILVFDVDIQNVDNFSVNVTTNINPSSSSSDTNCYRRNRTTQSEEAVPTIPSMRFTITGSDNSSLYGGWLTKSDYFNQTFNNLNSSLTYYIRIMLTFEDSNRTYDYYCNPSNINGPTFEMQINTNTTS